MELLCCTGGNYRPAFYRLGRRPCRATNLAPVAKAGGPGFESPATTKIFSHFSFAFFPDPLRKFQSSFYEGSELDNCGILLRNSV